MAYGHVASASLARTVQNPPLSDHSVAAQQGCPVVLPIAGLLGGCGKAWDVQELLPTRAALQGAVEKEVSAEHGQRKASACAVSADAACSVSAQDASA